MKSTKSKTDQEKVSEYLNYLVVEKALSENTIQAYSRDLQRFLAYLRLNGSEVAMITETTMAEFVAWLRGKNAEFARLSESSISRAVVSVRNFIKFWSKESDAVNPIATYAPPKIPKRLPKALTVGEVERLLSSTLIEAEPITLRDVALLEMLYATGARISEAIGLTVSDANSLVSGASDSVKLRGKGGKERIVPVGNFAKEALGNYLVRTRPLLANGKNNAALFLNLRGDPLSRQSAWGIVSDAAKRAKIEREVTPHSLRHSFATHLLDGGADIRVVQELLGHSSVTTTQIYTLITIDKLRESYSMAHPRAK